MRNRDAYMTALTVALADSAVKGFIKDPPVKNYGFAGNSMDGHPKAVSYVSAALTLVMAAAVAAAPPKMKLPMALILGGAISNTADRLIRGYVVDYIPMSVKNNSDKKKKGKLYYGNISDAAIFAGALTGAAAYMLEGDSKEEPSQIL